MNQYISILALLWSSLLLIHSPVTTKAQCSVNAGADQTICEGGSVTLTASASGTGPINYSWSNGSSSQSITVSPSNDQTYTVSIIDDDSCTASDQVTVQVNSSPTADYTYSPQATQCAPATVNFTDNSAGNNLSYQWDFDNGNNSSQQNPTVTFDPVGAGTRSYNVSLTVSNTANGCDDQAVKSVSVRRRPEAVLEDPFDNFSWCNKSSHEFTFYDKSTPGNASVDSFRLDWGDTSAVESGTSLPTSGISHTYGQGVFTLMYTVYGSNGCTNTFVQNVSNVTAPSIGTADTTGANRICTPDSLCFLIDNFSANDTSTTYEVRFGDRTLNIDHPPPSRICNEYTTTSCTTSNNKYVFEVIAENGCGSINSTIDPIKVGVPPDPQFTASPTLVCVNDQITFENLVETGYSPECDSSTQYEWAFGDGDTTTLVSKQNVTHSYDSAGQYSVTLSATNGCGTKSITKTVCVQQKVIDADFSMDTNRICSQTPTVIQTTNYSDTIPKPCGTNRYKWDVELDTSKCAKNSPGWYFASGDSTSVAPNIAFTEAGVYRIKLEVQNGCGTDDSLKTVTVANKPAITLKPLPEFCQEGILQPSVNYRNCYDSITSYQWSFPGGSPDSSSQAKPDSIFYDTPGDHPVTVSVTNTCGTTTITDTLTIFARPVANFSHQDACLGDSIHFTDQSTSPSGATITDWQWVFGDGDTSTQQNPSHLYSDTGTYQATLTVVDTNRCVGDTTIEVVTYPHPEADFAATNRCVGDTTNFTDQSTTKPLGGPITSRDWDFGDGSVDSVPNPAHQYSNADTFGVSLHVTDTNGCSDSYTDSIIVKPLPIAEYNPSDTSRCAPFVIDSTVLNITTYPQANNAYEWLVDDSSYANGPAFPGYTVTNDGDSVNICLVASNSLNCRPDTVCKTFFTYEKPVAGFTALPDTGCSPLNVQLNDTSSSGNSPAWDFSPFGTSTQDSLTATFTNPSSTKDTSYQVTLVATSGEGCKDTASQTVTVQPEPEAAFSINTNNACAPIDSVGVSNNATGKGNLDYKWQVVNSDAAVISDSTAVEPTFSFPDNQSGNDTIYSIHLIVTSADGCQDTAVQSITIDSRPVADFGIQEQGCGPLTISPSDSSSFVATYQWQADSAAVAFDDPSLAEPAITFPANNTDSAIHYTIALTTFTSNGCADTTSETVTIYPQPLADFTISNPDSCGPHQIDFTNSSDPYNGEPLSSMAFSWDFGDGDTSTLQNPAHIFSNTGLEDSIYNVSLVSATQHGCRDATAKDVTVYPDPVAELNPTDTVNCAPFTIDSSIINLTTFAEANDAYEWLLNGNAYANDSTFPSYTIPNDDDSISVCLVASNVHGCQPDTLCQTFSTIEDPVAGFTAVPDSGCHPLGVQFIDTSTAGTSITWDFGPYGTSSQDTVAQIFQNPSSTNDSSYTVRLVATGGSGCADTTYGDITVYPEPQAAFTLSIDSVCAPRDSVSMTNASSVKGSPTYQWQVTNSNAVSISDSTAEEPYFSFPDNNSGTDTTYNVQLIVTSPDQCRDTASRSITIYSRPVADFAVDTGGCGPLTVTTQNNAQYASAYQWEVDAPNVNIVSPSDSVTDIQFPVNSDTSAITYTVTLTAFTPEGCTDTATETVTIYPQPEADFAVSNADSCGPHQVPFTNNAVPYNGEPLSSMSFRWDFGDGDTATLQNPTHTFTNTGVADSIYTTSLIATTQHSCRDTTAKNVTVYPDPVARFSATDTLRCAPFTVDSTVIDVTGYPEANDSYEWLVDGNTYAGDTTFPSYTISSDNDTITACLVATNSHGCRPDTTCQQFITIEDPEATFTAVPDTGCHPLEVAFDYTGSANNLTWDFGNGNTATSDSVTETFLSPYNDQDTSYQVTLEAQAGTGCADTSGRLITVHPKPVADFTLSADSVCAPDTIAIAANNSAGKGTLNYRWQVLNSNAVDISDTAAATPTLTFPDNQSGTDTTYQVQLIVTSMDGCLDTLTKSVTIHTRPVADFSMPSSGCTPLSIQPTNNAQYGTSYQWEVTPSQNVAIDAATDSVPSISFQDTTAVSQTYTVTLTVVSAEGCADTASETITLDDPEAGFTNVPASGCHPLTVSFADTSSQGAISWNFDNGMTSSADSPTVTFANPSSTQDSTYTVSLVVETGIGCTDTAYQDITVHPEPQAAFTLSTDSVCAPRDSVSMTNASSVKGSPTYQWQVTNSNAVSISDSTAEEPYFSFPDNNSGTDTTYNVQLIVTSPDQCRDTASRSITIYSRPVADFAVDTGGCGPLTVTTQNNAQYASAYQWEVDAPNVNIVSPSDSVTDIQFPVNSDTSAITYTVTLTAFTPEGCTDTATETVTIYPQPEADFAVSNADSCGPHQVPFTNNAVPYNGEPLSSMSFRWDFGDGDTATLQNPTHTFTNTGVADSIYTTSLIATTQHSCRDTTAKNVTVYPDPVARFSATDTLRCAPFTVDSTVIDVTGYPEANDSYEWLVDGNTYAGDTTFPSYTISSDNDTITACLVATNSHGCRPDTTCQQFITIEDPEATFTAVPDTGCHPLEVAFDYTGSANNLSWDFGNGNGSSDTASSQTYVNNSAIADTSYTASLIAESSSGCRDTSSRNITVHPKPNAAFSLTTADTCAPVTNVDVVDASTFKDSASYEWQVLNSNAVGISNPSAQEPGLTFPGNQSGVDTTYNVQLVLTSANGCSDTASQAITIHSRPVADFAIDSVACGPATITPTNTSQHGDSYSWNVTPSQNVTINAATDSVPTIAFLDTTTITKVYTVTLTVFTQEGCADTITETITIQNPRAGYTAVPDSGCDPLTVQFTDTSSADNLAWDFSNGMTSSSDTPTVAFANNAVLQDSSYNVVLVAETGNGCKDSASQHITVHPRPNAAFTLNKDTVCAPAQVDVATNTSAGKGALAYNWQVTNSDAAGISNTSAQKPTIDIPNNQSGMDSTYNIRLIVTSEDGCRDTTAKSITARTRPVADFAVDSGGCGPLSVTPVNNSLHASSYSWQVTPSIDTIANATDSIPTLEFPVNTTTSPIVYDVTLISTTADGCTDTAVNTVTIYTKPEAAFIITPKDSGCGPLATSFTSVPSFASMSFEWDFGDGSSATGQNTSHTFLNPTDDDTSYTVTHVATTQYNCRDTAMQNVSVYDTYGTNLTLTDSIACDEQLTIYFDNATIATAKWVKIDFGDGEQKTLTSANIPDSISYNYENNTNGATTFSVEVIVQNQCTRDTVNRDVLVYPNAVDAGISADTTQGCRFETYTFTNTSQGSAYAHYRFQDGTGKVSDTSAQIRHSFSEPGEYTVIQEVYSADSCSSDKDSLTVTVREGPETDFDIVTSDFKCKQQQTVTFENYTQDAKSYLWRFGDGNTSRESSPAYQYDTTGAFTPTLIAENQQQCRDTLQKELTIENAENILLVPNALSPQAGAGETRYFKPKGRCLKNYKLEIYNTWGELIWNSTKLTEDGRPAEAWKGKCPDGSLCPQDVYVWKIEAVFQDGTVWQGKQEDGGNSKKVGSITLIR